MGSCEAQLRRNLNIGLKNRFGSRGGTALCRGLLQQFSRHGAELFGMLAEVGKQALLFCFPRCPYKKPHQSREKLMRHGGEQFIPICVRYSLTQTRRMLVATL